MCAPPCPKAWECTLRSRPPCDGSHSTGTITLTHMPRRAVLPLRASCHTGHGVCRISQRSFDGMGHQLEAKMGCIAAAATLPQMEYVHIGFRQSHSHGESMAQVEASLGLNRSFRAFDEKAMTMIHRRPGAVNTWPFMFPCTHCMSRANLSRACAETWHKPSWLHRAATDQSFRAEVSADLRLDPPPAGAHTQSQHVFGS